MKPNFDGRYSTIAFDAKPSVEVRDCLKSHGYRWAPSAGHWWNRTNADGHLSACEGIERLTSGRVGAFVPSKAWRPDYSDALYEDNCRSACGL